MIPRNKISVIKNSFQGTPGKVLCVCSGGVLRSPTAAALLCQAPYNFNTRSCGTEDYALIPMTEELVYWADQIVVADTEHEHKVMKMLDVAYIESEARPLVHVLGIPDMYDYMDQELVTLMHERFEELFGEV